MNTEIPILFDSAPPKSKHALAPSLAKAIQHTTGETVSTASASLQKQFIERLTQFDQMIEEAVAGLSACSLESVTISLSVSADGRLGVAAFGSAGNTVSSVMQVTLKPKVKNEPK